jgi:hypothetical protein
VDDVSIISGPELDGDQTKLKQKRHEEIGDITTQVKKRVFSPVSTSEVPAPARIQNLRAGYLAPAYAEPTSHPASPIEHVYSFR